MEVTCLDENDSPPIFDESLKIVLSEAFLPGQRIAKVKATDKDLVREVLMRIEIQITWGKNFWQMLQLSW